MSNIEDPEVNEKEFDTISDITSISTPNTSLTSTHPRPTITFERSSEITPTRTASPDSKYTSYNLLVDPSQNDKAVEIILASLARPHMRGFHLSWLSFFICFFLWFALAPLLGDVEKSLGLSKQELWMSSMYSVAGSALLRIIIGPLCDRFGARSCVCIIMFVSAFFTSLQTIVQTNTGLNVARLVVGFAGGSFVTCIYWTSSMFTKEVAGTANALAAGWGNLGGGAAQLVMGSILCPFFRWVLSLKDHSDPDMIEDKAWRAAIIIPGVFAIIASLTIFQGSDDCPKGNYNKRQHGRTDEVHPLPAFWTSISNYNTWILLIQYGCSFGVETTIYNMATIYFEDEFGVPSAAAAAISSIFGIMNLFARGLGGFLSDYGYAYKGMKGRLICQLMTYILEGLMLIVFAASTTLSGSIISLAIFSIFVQMAEGSTFGIVPNVNPKVTGSITGLVGSGGNIGGIIFSLLLSMYSYRTAMKFIAFFVLCGALLSFGIRIDGHSTLSRSFEIHHTNDNDSENIPSNVTFSLPSSKAIVDTNMRGDDRPIAIDDIVINVENVQGTHGNLRRNHTKSQSSFF